MNTNKRFDLSVNLNNITPQNMEEIYNKLLKGLNPIHPTGTKALKEEIISRLGYVPEFK